MYAHRFILESKYFLGFNYFLSHNSNSNVMWELTWYDILLILKLLYYKNPICKAVTDIQSSEHICPSNQTVTTSFLSCFLFTLGRADGIWWHWVFEPNPVSSFWDSLHHQRKSACLCSDRSRKNQHCFACHRSYHQKLHGE